ncbi:unnamed protein product [Heligmosomoides polygyrus]|uniref:Peptidase A2 domain-containing protein n=1 Tax=Heligmosomoides polygyrus TaxID=6339 RepID=A0A183FHX5_HELPZ|nr:unnamed protein product [Heligmosomoides polygyrus]
MHVLSLGSDHAFFVAEIPVRVNGIRMLAFVDTGAGITVASKALTPLLGITHMEASLIPAAVGMAGIPVKFVGRSVVFIQAANQKIDHTLHFTDSQCIPSGADSYNIMLGNDLLGRLPSWSMDYQKRLFHVGDDYVQTLPVQQKRGSLSSTQPSSRSVSQSRYCSSPVQKPLFRAQ